MAILKSNHRGVGGLISLVALIIVFGIASIAFLDINAIQSRFLEASIEVNNIQMNRNNEQLNFTASSGLPYTVEMTNMWSRQTVLDSYVAFDSAGTITIQRYLNETTIPNKQNIIPSGHTTSIVFDIPNATVNDVKILFVTENGKQCIVPIPISWRVC
ncbi:hypothetical protein [Candidatus Nitrosotenuis uzonensis]|uniref:Uncharacterized protein n=1 Tax=Candidatus Nitrosotenuis uzonensis TaxID=1407055 RepID=V6ASR2_9ARCH|nr:hypothetical protein [Candidatus Nitrosotenuis uzonensis]CDI05652.1 exported hypothetical protein [Candidatus Nitrosotenuis uzonensis]